MDGPGEKGVPSFGPNKNLDCFFVIIKSKWLLLVPLKCAENVRISDDLRPTGM